eukprot:IDg6604t1
MSSQQKSVSVPAGPSGQLIKFAATSVEHPRLSTTDVTSIRLFFAHTTSTPASGSLKSSGGSTYRGSKGRRRNKSGNSDDSTKLFIGQDKNLLFCLYEENSKTGASHSTRGHKAAAHKADADGSKYDENKVTGRLSPPAPTPCSSSFLLFVSDGKESMTAQCQIDDGSDESIASSKFS